MLLLKRKVGQEIIIRGNIHVKVLGKERNFVSIGISAPKEDLILRDELFATDNAKREKQEKTPKGGMLVLTRKINQGFVIAGNIHVLVLDVGQVQVNIGISAPLEVTILRQELLEKDEAERRRQEASGEGDGEHFLEETVSAREEGDG